MKLQIKKIPLKDKIIVIFMEHIIDS